MPDGTNYQRISYAELAKATNSFADANLIGVGKFGSVYMGTLPLKVKGGFEGGTVAVKVFNLQQVGASKTFLSECEALRTVRHRNLISIITCCSSITPRGDDFRALVFELMPNYSLDRWLHPTPEDLKNVGRLTAIQRLNIAVDIADALHYLHCGCVPPIIHCDLKPSNVLLGEDMTACIGDFGLAKLLLDPGIHDITSSESTIGIRGTIGYVAPGNLNTRLTDSDVLLHIAHISLLDLSTTNE
jgi:serine/threonine protein kinase